MSNNWEDRERALEEGYFRQKDNELIAKMREKLSTSNQTGETFQCPKCEGKLHTGNFENVQIDVCNTCHGVWLDAGELQRITHKDDPNFFGRLFS